MNILTALIDSVIDNKYHIERLLGQGGMGAVYMATHLGTTRPVAIKIISPKFMEYEEFVERFKREAEASGRLLHPNIVNVTDFGFASVRGRNVAYLVMEYLSGNTLADMLKKYQRLSLSVVVDFTEQICLAISAAHQQGIIHRDLKPDNIWLQSDGRGGYTVKVLDFGLAKLHYSQAKNINSSNGLTLSQNSLENNNESKNSLIQTASMSQKGDNQETENNTLINESEIKTKVQNKEKKNSIESFNSGELTQAGAILGTPLYMSPEQCLGKTLSTATDIYSLGIIVYQMLAGEPPFTGNFTELKEQHSKTLPTLLSIKHPDIPKPVARLVDLALAKLPESRPISAASFASALRANSEGAGKLLQQALIVYSEHFWKFIRISLISYIPFIIVLVLHLVNEFQPKQSLLSSRNTEDIALILRLLMILSGQIAISVNSGMFVPVLVQLQLAPLQNIYTSAVLKEFKKRLYSFSITSILFAFMTSPLIILMIIVISREWLMLMVSPSSLQTPKGFSFLALVFILVSVGIKLALDYSLYPSIVMLEANQGIVALRRAKELARRVWPTIIAIYLPLLLLAIVNLFILFGLLVDSQIKTDILINNLVSYRIDIHLYDSLLALIIILVGVVANPLFAILLAMIYLKSRQVVGDTLENVLGKFKE
ncbi:MAG: serine/threonine protein kinase [Acidobacteria bacterium]|nr:serine/threonine protein kinase [Acidobacteriota bacterium]